MASGPFVVVVPYAILKTGEAVDRDSGLGTEAAEDDPDHWDREDLQPPDEEDVRLAAVWSVDPSSLGDPELEPSVGVVGRIYRLSGSGSV